MSSLGKLELKLPPVVVVLLVGLMMAGSARIAPNLAFAVPSRRAVAIGLAVVGTVIALAGVVSFRRARTTVDPRYPQRVSALVTSGIYRFTRNPMYLGMLVTLAGWAVELGHVLPFLFLPLFVAVLNRLQIQPEERVLVARFGPEFAEYSARVRRWI
jgi:protein-S-isoprenylcysteine O-methyltransferase Ste14